MRTAHPLAFKFDPNVLVAQAYGCWLYVQLGSRAWFFGSRMPCGLRIEWRPEKSWLPRIRWVRHGRTRIAAMPPPARRRPVRMPPDESTGVPEGLPIALLDLAIRQLNPVEAWVIRELHGIPSPVAGLWQPVPPRGRDHEALSRDSGLSPHRIRQIEEAAMARLRQILAHAPPPPPAAGDRPHRG